MILKTTDRNLIGCLGNHFIEIVFLEIIAALDSALYGQSAAYNHSGRVPGIFSPADAGNVVCFSTGTVDRDHKICDFFACRCDSKNWRPAEITVQHNLVFQSIFCGSQADFPGIDRENQPASIVDQAVVGTKLPLNLNIFSFLTCLHVNHVVGNHHRDAVCNVAASFDQDIYEIEAFSVNLVAEGEIRIDHALHGRLVGTELFFHVVVLLRLLSFLFVVFFVCRLFS